MLLCWHLMKTELQSETRLILPPGTKLNSIAKFLYTKKKYESVFLPAITDLRDEYFEALSTGNTWKVRWVHFRGAWSFFAAVLTDIPLSFVGLVVKLWITAK